MIGHGGRSLVGGKVRGTVLVGGRLFSRSPYCEWWWWEGLCGGCVCVCVGGALKL